MVIFYPIVTLSKRAKTKVSREKRKKPLKANKSQGGNLNKLRIIGGQWRGRKLDFPSVEGLRPTTDRVRETVFNWLSPYLAGSECLDLFAGSGALGFEAVSRGAAHTTLVELDRNAYQYLLRNKEILQSTELHIENKNAIEWLESNNKQYDIVFIDPPFNKGIVEECLNKLKPQLKENALIYLEMGKKEPLPTLPDNWTVIKEKTAGDVCYRLIQQQVSH